MKIVPSRQGREPKAPGWVVDDEETHPGGFAATPPQRGLSGESSM